MTTDTRTAQDKGSKADRRAAQKKRKRTVMLLLVAMVPLGLIMLPTTLILLIGMIPTLVAFVADRHPEKYAAITVGGPNFCGVMPSLLALWTQGHHVQTALHQLSDPFKLLLIFGLSAVGWVIYYSVPPFISMFISKRNEATIRDMRDLQKALVDEYGEEVSYIEAVPRHDDLHPGVPQVQMQQSSRSPA